MTHPGPAILLCAIYTIVSGLQAVLLGVLTLRRKYREFPLFYTYTAVEVFRAIAVYWVLYLFMIHRLEYAFYFRLYWWTEALAVALIFGIMYRIFAYVMGQFHSLRAWVPWLFAGATLLLACAAALSVRMESAASLQRMTVAMLLMDRSITFVRCGMVLLLLLCSRGLRLAWDSKVLGIALGFGVASSIDLLALSWVAEGWPGSARLLLWTGAIGYAIAVGIWATYFLRRDGRSALSVEPRVPVTRWNEAVVELLRQ